MQRFFDIFFSSLGLILLSPLLILIIIILKFSGEGEIFFLQDRVGKDGNFFKLFKFATMLKNSPNMGTGTLTLKDDPRILPFGIFLRKTKVNELPQLINIFKGDMSIIGPRPQTKRCFNAFPLSSQNEIKKVKPGLSGIGSIVFRSEENMMLDNENPDDFYDKVVMPYKGSLEKWFVNNNNIFLYFYLIVITFWVTIGFSSRVVWIFFNNLPQPPHELEKWL